MQRQAFYNSMYANQMRQVQYQYNQYRQNPNSRVIMPQPIRTPSQAYMANYYNPRQNRQVNQLQENKQVQKVQARQETVQQVDYTSRVYQNARDIEQDRNTKVKSSLWNKFLNSKFVKSIKYAFKVRVVLQLPEGEGATANNNNKIQENKEEKEAKLLASALKLFTEKCVKETSVQEITDEAGVAKGTFYLYFKDKYEIQDFLIAKMSKQLFSSALKKLSKQNITDYKEKAIFVIDYIIDELTKNKLLLKFISKNLSSSFLYIVSIA